MVEITSFISLCLNVASGYLRHKPIPEKPQLVSFDMDSTLIVEEVIDELARESGCYDEVSAVTEEAMRGELDFN